MRGNARARSLSRPTAATPFVRQISERYVSAELQIAGVDIRAGGLVRFSYQSVSRFITNG